MTLHSDEGIQYHWTLFYGMTSTSPEWIPHHWKIHCLCDKSLPPHPIYRTTYKILVYPWLLPLCLILLYEPHKDNYLHGTQRYKSQSTYIWHQSSLWNGTALLIAWIHNFFWYPLTWVKFTFIQLNLFIWKSYQFSIFALITTCLSNLALCIFRDGSIFHRFGTTLNLHTASPW